MRQVTEGLSYAYQLLIGRRTGRKSGSQESSVAAKFKGRIKTKKLEKHQPYLHTSLNAMGK
eukprot:2498932-Amphidinium_carterae.1